MRNVESEICNNAFVNHLQPLVDLAGTNKQPLRHRHHNTRRMSLTLTSLLDSLHTHLQTQTELLPTLHAQLGLPSNALEDELKILQQHLMQSVESQIDVRRKEVDEWMGKCSGVEDVCVRYGKALGANVKVAGASIGELRKEQVLPKRYQLVTAQQEKLRQVSVECTSDPASTHVPLRFTTPSWSN